MTQHSAKTRLVCINEWPRYKHSRRRMRCGGTEDIPKSKINLCVVILHLGGSVGTLLVWGHNMF